MNLIISLVLALVASVSVNLYQWRHNAVAIERIHGEQNTAVAEAVAQAQKDARAAEAASAKASNDAGQAYEEGKRDVEAKTDQFVADLRPHDVELRDTWKGCPAARVPETAAAARQPDAAADRQRESLQRIASDMGRARREAGNAGAQIAALQQYISTVCAAPGSPWSAPAPAVARTDFNPLTRH